MSLTSLAMRATALGLSAALCAGLGSNLAYADTPTTPPDELTAAAVEAVVTAADPTGLELAPVTLTSAGDMTSTVSGSSVEIPADPANGVTISAEGAAPITINLPGAAQADSAQVIGDTVVYENAAPSTDIAVQATANGGVRQLITIAGPAAPSSYDFPVDIPQGGSIVLTDDGGAQIINGDTILAVVAPAWARDTNGGAIPTNFTTDGSTLTQHVSFDENTAFPVTADPFWSMFGSYVACITGVGVPLGAAIAFASYVGLDALYVLAINKSATVRLGGPPIIGSIVRPYARAVYNNCRRFILS